MEKISAFFIAFFLSFILPFKAYAQHEHMDHGNMTNMEMSGEHQQMQMQEGHDMNRSGMYGAYPMTREASGTAWQPDSSPHDGIHLMQNDWRLMLHGYANFIYDHQGGDRGDDKTFSQSMFMLMAQRDLSAGTLGIRTMLSLDPLQGKDGYPLLLQTGETADGVSGLVDRQHPHDLFMELALTYQYPFSEESSLFGYVGLPGEPALGPPAFMHRFSGIDNPEAPLSHHWLDSTHITFGVVTLGYIWKNLKWEVSSFRGREPDESRWDIETPELDSYSTRLSYNPHPNWSFQISYGDLDSPEQLHPSIDTERFTMSGAYNLPFEGGNWQTMLAWGRNNFDPGETLDAYLLESTVQLQKTHTFFSRYEYTQKNELFPEGDPLEQDVFNVNKATLGYIYDFPEWKELQWGIGGSYSLHFLPNELDGVYGKNPAAYMLLLE